MDPFMDIGATDSGGCVSVVVDIEVQDPLHERHLVQILHSGAQALVRGLIEGTSTRLTLVDAVVVKQFPSPELEIGPNTKVMYHTRHSWADFYKLVDACSGLGGVSHGALSVGVHTTVSVDCNQRMSNLHKVHSSSETVTGDVGHPQVIHELWRKSDHAAILSAGFACQPYSQLGDRRGALDPRSQCLPSVLHAALLLQVRVVVLECVTPARGDHFVAQQLEKFAQIGGVSIEAINLDLQTVWPCRRHRAWWVLYDSCLGKIGLTEWQSMSGLPKIQCLIPYICKWDPRDELALRLDQRECQAFGVEDGTYPKHMMTANGIGPTALHAWGSQLRACPCGCRDFGLSTQRLQDKGLFGLLVSSSSEVVSDQPIRHVHPSEALALNGMDCTIDFGLDVRLTLSGIGQIASPLQAAWIFGSVLSRVEALSKESGAFGPLTQLMALRSWLVMKCQQVWPCTSPVIEDKQLLDMISFWQPVKGLSLEQLVHPPFWDEQHDDRVSIASVLDMLIRQKQVPLSSINSDEAVTPWIESPVSAAKCDASFSVGSSDITFVDAQGSCLQFRFQAGSTAVDVLVAHAKLTGSMHVAYICDQFGRNLKMDDPIQAGQKVQIFFASDGSGMSFGADTFPEMPAVE